MEWISETKKGRKPIKLCVIKKVTAFVTGFLPSESPWEAELFQLTGKGTDLPTPHPSLV